MHAHGLRHATREVTADAAGSIIWGTAVMQIAPFNLKDPKVIRDLNPEDVECLISVAGMVTRTSNIIPDLRSAALSQACMRVTPTQDRLCIMHHTHARQPVRSLDACLLVTDLAVLVMQLRWPLQLQVLTSVLAAHCCSPVFCSRCRSSIL